MRHRGLYSTLLLALVFWLAPLCWERERHLETRFAAGTMSEAELEQLVAAIAILHGQLRAVHLRAHLAQRNILTLEQMHQYDALRGYHASGHPNSRHHHGH